MCAVCSAKNLPNPPEFICPICLPKPKSSGFQWKKASLGVRSPWKIPSFLYIETLKSVSNIGFLIKTQFVAKIFSNTNYFLERQKGKEMFFIWPKMKIFKMRWNDGNIFATNWVLLRNLVFEIDFDRNSWITYETNFKQKNSNFAWKFTRLLKQLEIQSFLFKQ